MTNEQLTAYLQDETYLYSVSYEELKTLVMQYPYSSNLRILLLKKSFLDQNKDYDRNLQMSATYGTNRKHLYKTIKKLKSFKLAPQNVILGEDYLELTELSNIERLLADRQVTEAVSSTVRLDSLAADWQLEIDDIAFNEEPKIEDDAFDLSHLNQNLKQSPKKNRTEEDEIDSLINSLVTKYKIPTLDFSQEIIDNDIIDNELVIHSTNSKIEDKTFEFEEEVISLDETETSPQHSNTLELTDLLGTGLDATMVSSSMPNVSIPSPSVNFDFSGDAEEKNEEEDILIEEELNLMAAKEDFEPLENLIAESPIHIIEKPHFESQESPEDVKKANIELEIVNQTKAPLVDTHSNKNNIEKKPSFTEWLSQFRMTGAAAPAVTPPEVIEVQSVIPIMVDETVRKSSRKNMLDLFEAESEVPDNLFGLADKKPKNTVLDNLEEEDDDDDDEIFSDDDDAPKKKKKRPMHQLAVKSLIQADDMVSETLADLLAWQGNKSKAIEMYRKLILQFPEKSAYFATKIEKISN